ncbi:MAG: superoxide dismutase [Cyclobacteriaceae bacterium]|nr:superoxide dismutase [Cyclobacteriaceae bacterium]
MNLKKTISALTLVLLFTSLNVQFASAHCEIPCGIYADSIRISLIREDITTIEKAMKQIEELSGSEKPNYNQLVRWITNKEEHANKIQETVSQYFLHQRIKIVAPDQKEAYAKYQKHLELLHKISVYAMLSKQGTDLANIEKLRSTVDEFEKAYFHKH